MTELRLGSILMFLLRFLVLLPFCLVLWWLILPYYGMAQAVLVKIMLMHTLGVVIEAIEIVPEGILNTKTQFIIHARTVSRGISLGDLATNIAPYAALILATVQIPLRSRLRALAMGIGVLMFCHWTYIILAFYFAKPIRNAPSLPAAFAEVFLTLPFLLWAVFAYSERLSSNRPPEESKSASGETR